MTSVEHGRVGALSSWYLKEQLDFDRRLIRYRYESIKPKFVGQRLLELGPAEGEMTQFLVNDFAELTLVEGSRELLNSIPNYDNVIKYHMLFEEFEPEQRFDSIIMDHVLEHVEHPVELLARVRGWLTPGGRLFVGVPNGNSIHRLAAVKMGLLEHQCQLNPRDQALGHRRVYTMLSFKADIERSGLRIVETGGVYLKPLSNGQIQENWNEQMIEGFFELGKDFPDLCAEIFAVCELP